MDQNNHNSELTYPFQAMPTEEQFHLYHSISASVVGDNEKEVQFVPICGSILITNERLCWFSLPKQADELTEEEKLKLQSQSNEKKIIVNNSNGKSFMFTYDNLVSHGLQGNNFLCFLGAQEEEEMEMEDEQESLGELIKQDNPAYIVNLDKGEYQVSIFYTQINFDFSQLTKEQQQQLIELFTQYSSANIEEEDEDEYMGEMITADNIDQDGNIVIKKANEDDDDDDYEDVDDDEDQFAK